MPYIIFGICTDYPLISEEMFTFTNLGKFGRLGNQLFQIAATMGIANKHNMNCIFPDWEYSDRISVATSNEITKTPWKAWHEHTFHFNPDAFSDSFNADTDLQGYFQTEKYFKHCKDEVIGVILNHRNIDMIESMTCGHIIGRPDTDVCAIHIRRGDYMHLQNHYVNLVSTPYYINAIKRVRSLGVRHFVIFSDDINWCKANLEFDHDGFTYSGLKSAFDNLLFMSACTCHIMANSSFSWWGSYLSNSRLTIAPEQWFGPAITHDAKDLYRDDMILM